MKVYIASTGMDWEFDFTIGIMSSYEKAVEAVVRFINAKIYLGDVDGIEGQGDFRHLYLIEDYLHIFEVEVNEIALCRRNTQSRVVLDLDIQQIKDFVESPEFYQGQDFTAEMAESMNMVKRDNDD